MPNTLEVFIFKLNIFKLDDCYFYFMNISIGVTPAFYSI